MDIELFLSAFAILFVVVDPPGCAPIFATLTQGTSKDHQRQMAFKSVFIATIILLLFAYLGEFIFAKLGISLDALRIAGGIMLFMIGLNMVFEKRTETRQARAEHVLEDEAAVEDISVFPMAIPMIAGPGTMGSLLILMSEARTLSDEIAILSALCVTLLITLISFLAVVPLLRILGESVAEVLTRVFGILLVTLAAQFVIDGIKGALFPGLM